MGAQKISIVGGAGGVGASLAFNLLRDGAGDEVVLIDSRPNMVTSHLMDLEQTLEQGSSGTVRAGEQDDVRDSDVVVMSAGAPLTVNTSRMIYLEDNARIMDATLDLLDEDWGGTLLVVTNPVDPLVTWAQRRSGIDRRRVIGYTLNDTLRFRTGIAMALGADLGSVEAWVIGEHGDACVPLHDRVTVDGEPVELTPEQSAAAEDFLRTWYVRHVALDSGRSSTWTSGLGIARMVRALSSNGAGELWPGSVVLDGEYGIRGLAIGVPVTLGNGGVQQVHEWELTSEQRAGFHSAAALVRGAAEAILGSPSF
jgi:malate dehydrogenase